MTRLAGRRVLVTRSRNQAGILADALRLEGAAPILLPTIEVRAIDPAPDFEACLERLEEYRWLVFTSVNGVETFWERARVRFAGGALLPPDLRIAAIGEATARAVRGRGLHPAFVPDEFSGARLGETLPRAAGGRVLIARARLGDPALADGLRAQGALVDDIAIYSTLPASLEPAGLAELERGVDAATFTSPSTVRNFATLLGPRAHSLLWGAVIGCIGPVTAREARALGLAPAVTPDEHTIPALVRGLADHFAGASPRPFSPC